MSLISFINSGNRCLKARVSGVLISTLFIFAGWGCTTDCAIKVNFTGLYSDETCNVIINNASASETVTLPQISTSALQKDGNEAGVANFDIALTDCPASRTITLFFNSNANAADKKTGNLVNAVGMNYSRNVQVRLKKEDGSQVIVDDKASGQDYVIPSSAEQVSHGFSASYYAKGDAAVTAGLILAIAGVELFYN